MNSEESAKPQQQLPEGWLLAGLILCPVLFFWAMLQDQYSKSARVVAFAWTVLWGAILLGGIASRMPAPPARKQPDQIASAPPAQTSDMVVATKPVIDPAQEKRDQYMISIDREIAEREKQLSIKYPSGEQAAVMSSMLTFGLWGKLYEEGAALGLSPEEEARRQRFRSLAQRAQAQAFPKIRAMQGRLWRNGLWEHDVDVILSGSGNRRITLRGGIFLSRRAMQEVKESMEETLAMLHFTRVTFEPWRGGRSTWWDLEAAPDDQLARVGERQWVPIKH